MRKSLSENLDNVLEHIVELLCGLGRGFDGFNNPCVHEIHRNTGNLILGEALSELLLESHDDKLAALYSFGYVSRTS